MRRFMLCCAIGLVASLGIATNAGAGGGAALMRQMKATGKPALIIAGNESCVYCRQMAAQLSGNEGIQPLVQQFFVLKVDTDSADWPLLQRAFQFNKNGIPAVFVVRGDGKLLYSESGKPRDMGAFLRKQLDAAGAILDARQLRAIQQAVRDARVAIKRRKLAEAVAIVKEHGDSGSYATAALQLAELKDGLVSKAINESDKVEARIANDRRAAHAAIDLVGLRQAFAELPAANEHVDAVWTRLAEDEQHQELMQHAERLRQAAELHKERKYDEALAIYKEIAGASPESQAGTHAQTEAAAIERRLAARSGGAADDADSNPGDSVSEKSSDINAKRAASYIKLAKVFRDKKPDKAREYLQKAIESAPESAEADEAQKLLDELE